MKTLLIVVLVIIVGWQSYRAYKEGFPANAEHRGVADIVPPSGSAATRGDAAAPGPFSCDGRTRCSQMTSCAEATFFLKNCPGVEVYGNDGSTHCWLQWCKD